MEKSIYFVRHGETDSNASGMVLGKEAMLTEKGKQEAKIVAERVHRIGVDAIVASTYQRAIDTAQSISDRIGLPVETSDLLIEWERPSSLKGHSWRGPEVKQIEEDLLNGYLKDENFVHSDEE